ncbi:alpha/beta hydrolase [Spirillospora sp. NPDC047279]|uniref:alpha/beta fold hydrolase n=1 Tax=Spirillospora sp. NPDC047279 TaxID=3155478 RepID=UPI00340A001D
MPAITVGRARVEYRAEGTGQGLVLLHGTGPGSSMWDGLVGEFSDRNTVILPDVAGSEKAEDDGGDLTVEALAAQVAAVIEDSGAAPVDLLGFSLGAPIAAAVAATRPELVRRLVLAAGWSHLDDEYLRTMMTVWREIADNPPAFGRFATLTAFSGAFLNSIGREAVEQNAAYMRPTPGVLRQLDLNLRLDVRELLPLVRAETLVIGCTRDATVPVENARGLHAAIAGSAYAEIDCGHVAPIEKPAEFVTLVADFVRRP